MYVFGSGQKYEGHWEKGKKHGWSIYTVETGMYGTSKGGLRLVILYDSMSEGGTNIKSNIHSSVGSGKRCVAAPTP